MGYKAYHPLLKEFISVGNATTPWRILQKLIRSGIVIPLPGLQMFFEYHIAHKQHDLLMSLVGYMDKAGIPKDLKLYRTLFYYFLSENLTTEMAILLQEMVLVGTIPEEDMYSSAMNAFGKVDRVDLSEYFFEQMQQLGIRPTRAHYNALVRCLSSPSSLLIFMPIVAILIVTL